jgi:hypothetical protein
VERESMALLPCDALYRPQHPTNLADLATGWMSVLAPSPKDPTPVGQDAFGGDPLVEVVGAVPHAHP